MGSFNDGFWNLFIIVVTLSSILGLYLFLLACNKGRSSANAEAKSMGHVWDEDLHELNNPLPKWWLNMFLITLAFGVVYLLLYPGLGNNSMLLGWTQTSQYEAEMQAAEERYGPLFARYAQTPVPELAANAEALRMGERLFASYCTQCHGSDGGGVRGFPNLRDGDWQWGGSPEAIQTSILAGRQAVMPPWGAALGGEAGVEDMAQYVLALSGREHDAAMAARAQPQFAQLCVACHGADGKGNQALGAPDLTNDIWLYGGSARAIGETLTLGRQGRMPAHEEFLGQAKVHLLATYVWSLSNRP